jgi:hypothetical protein
VTILKKFEKTVLALQTGEKEIPKSRLKNIFSEDIHLIRNKLEKLFNLFCEPKINRSNLTDIIQVNTNGELEKDINDSLSNSLDFLQEFNNVLIKFKHPNLEIKELKKEKLKYEESKEIISSTSEQELKKNLSALILQDIEKIKKVISDKKEENPNLINNIENAFNELDENYENFIKKSEEILQGEFKDSEKNLRLLVYRLRFLCVNLRNLKNMDNLDFRLCCENNFYFQDEINKLDSIESD